MSDLKIGVINWDGCLESDKTYFGGYCAKTLTHEKYINRVPFYADGAMEHKVSFHKRTQEEFDTEMKYAIEAGIDYFAYVWYTERSEFAADENVSETARHVHELTYIRKLHMASELNTKIKMCAIMSAHPITDAELLDLAEEMQKPYYQYIDEKPLVYIYTGYDKDLIARLRAACKKAGTNDPYVAIFTNAAPAKDGECYELADAVSAYCIHTEERDCESSADFNDELIEMNRLMLTYNLPVIPMYGVGWNPNPRVDVPVPWYGYSAKKYAPPSVPEQIENGAADLASWLKSEKIAPRHILSYAWNEFEEGGYICPTFLPDGGLDTSRVKAFRNAVEYLKNEF